VRKVLAPGDRSALIPGNAYEDQAFYVSASCDREPCPTVEVKITPLGRASPVTVAVLDRTGTHYVSAAKAENEGPCLNDAGDRVTGGATVSSTMRLWAEKVRPAGTAVETTMLIGTQTLDLVPTAIGEAAGCARQTASYDLTGRLASTTGRVEPTEPDQPPNTAGGVASLPSIGIKVSGVKIVYFPIEGDTLDELIGSLARGGVRACGEINYEWHQGDDRPAACAITGFNELEEAIDREVGSTGKCAITRAEVKPRFTIHFPRWAAPKTVPKRLLAWWRDVVVLIRDHEAGHIRISRNHVKTLNADLLGATCLQANRIIREWATKLSNAHEEFDRVEYALPWPEPPAGY
jgi:predicted secreted Zn-dependent protease